MSQRIEGNLLGAGAKIAIVTSRFNDFIVDRLESGAVGCLLQHGVQESDITTVKVPGAFELPLACQQVARTGHFDGVLALGCVIRGGTPHFEFVAGEMSKGLSKVSLEQGIPLGFGVLTTNSLEQAIERAGSKMGNKGAEAALAVLEMINLLRKVETL